MPPPDRGTSGSRRRPPDFLRLAEVGHGVGNGVVVFEPEQRGQFLLVQLLHAHGDVMGQDEVEEHLLFGAETVLI